MVSIGSRRSQYSSLSRCRLCFVGMLALLAGTMYYSIRSSSYEYKMSDLSTLAGMIPACPEITSWEQIEEQMVKIDPAKAERWKQFLESDGKASMSIPQQEVEQQIQLLPEVPTATTVPATEVPAQTAPFTTIDEVENARAAVNSEIVKDWRTKFLQAADLTDENDHGRETKFYAEHGFTPSNLRKCKYVFLDFGSNIGDSLMKVIDSFVPAFKTGTGNTTYPMYHVFNTTTGNFGPLFYDGPKRKNPNKWILPRWVKMMIEKYNAETKKKDKSDPVYPEDYCFYGVEGNPHFTPLLRREEINIMNMIPRPIRHVHFLTEHVGAGLDGPTTLFLDTVNAKDNFWGSSTVKSHVDVVKSGGNTGISVMGITLTRLLMETVAPGGHVMIKIDIEGGEYELLEEAINSKILCKMTRELGVKVDMLNEPHNAQVVGSEKPGNRWKEIQGDQQIKSCGVNYGKQIGHF